jgi:hypothetical protein
LPVPDSVTVCAEDEAESKYDTVAASAPADCGVNVITFMQLAPAASGLTQFVFILLKELAPAPVIVVVPVKVTAADVLFVSVIVCVAALVPTVVEAKLSVPGVIVSPAPVPLSATVCAADDAES